MEKLERYEEALVAYDKAIALQPEDAESWRNRGAVLSELQRYEEAIASLSQAISIQQNLRNLTTTDSEAIAVGEPNTNGSKKQSTVGAV